MFGRAPFFADRADAGRQLGRRLAAMDLADPVVFGLPRGGIPVAAEVARGLNAPLDLVLVRKIGAPGAPELALGAVVDGHDVQLVINEDVRRLTNADDAYLESAKAAALAEIGRRRVAYLADRPRVSIAGRTAIVVDDGLATGATAKAALRALKRQGAAKLVLAVPVAPLDTLEDMRGEADEVVCLGPTEYFPGVGAFYRDFHQLSDGEAVALLGQAWAAHASDPAAGSIRREVVRIPPLALAADLQVPAAARGVVAFAHGSGSSRLSPRNRAVADDLNHRGFATLLLDLLTEEEAEDRRNVFDISLLAERLIQAADWMAQRSDLAGLPLGLFGASTGAAAALQAAATLGDRVGAVVSRGGRPDLAGDEALARVKAPTLLIVGAADDGVIDLNRAALRELQSEKAFELVPHATHLFEEPGALEMVMRLAGAWFERHLVPIQPKAPANKR
jgi:predicted phosphoribosyltransferase/dienelactone hydrolase